MPDIKKVIRNPDTPSPRRADRALDLQEWDEEQGRRLAEQEGIELTEAHWEVVRCLRDYYLEHDPPESGRELSDMLDNAFAEQGGRKGLRIDSCNGMTTLLDFRTAAAPESLDGLADTER